MAGKLYRCFRWPELRIGRLQFQNSLLQTTSEEEDAIVEKADGFGREITVLEETKLPPEKAEKAAPETEAEADTESAGVEEGSGGVAQGSRGTAGGARPPKKK